MNQAIQQYMDQLNSRRITVTSPTYPHRSVVLAISGTGKSHFLHRVNYTWYDELYDETYRLVDADQHPSVHRMYSELVTAFGPVWWKTPLALAKKSGMIESILDELPPRCVLFTAEAKLAIGSAALAVVDEDAEAVRQQANARALRANNSQPTYASKEEVGYAQAMLHLETKALFKQATAQGVNSYYYPAAFTCKSFSMAVDYCTGQPLSES